MIFANFYFFLTQSFQNLKLKKNDNHEYQAPDFYCLDPPDGLNQSNFNTIEISTSWPCDSVKGAEFADYVIIIVPFRAAKLIMLKIRVRKEE